ncbi:hypothetical protein [Mesorhizobium sp.]|uniref:hypothetical protein n=1 Tax=Mesorhizobium sp. TaxID=1871066 RepID=UPI0025E54567|nr:hypothetical protein [Mesorhizobium sp.]
MEKGLPSLLAEWLSARPVPSQAGLGLGLVLLANSVLKTPVVAGVFRFKRPLGILRRMSPQGVD